MSFKDFVKIKPIALGSNIILVFVIIYLFGSYYHLIPDELSFLENQKIVFLAWIYLMVNLVAVNIFKQIRRYKSRKECPHCGDSLAIHKYKCEKCDREI